MSIWMIVSILRRKIFMVRNLRLIFWRKVGVFNKKLVLKMIVKYELL